MESLPSYDSHHKYELPAQNLLPRAPKDTPEHLQQISQQLFALCYSVEDFINLPNEKHIPGMSSTIGIFSTRSSTSSPGLSSPRTFTTLGMSCTVAQAHIAHILLRVNLFESLVNTEITTPLALTELVNPGADAPAPLSVFVDGEPLDEEVAIDTVAGGNRYTKRKDFELVQNSLSETDLVEYTVEFVPDKAPKPHLDDSDASTEDESLGVEEHEDAPEPESSKLARKAKAPSKGSQKGKAKAVDGEAREATESKQRAGKKRTASEAAHWGDWEDREETPATTTATRPRSARIAAKASKSTEPPAPPPTLAPPTKSWGRLPVSHPAPYEPLPCVPPTAGQKALRVGDMWYYLTTK
ncbi:hypothetical protein B0H13DRAFT_1999808 [Mycena leptocephala]|nr:hypothetical protein B0H13DRAFT_1999808 [Mycena leptocephala]